MGQYGLHNLSRISFVCLGKRRGGRGGQGGHIYLGDKFDAFFNVFFMLGVFLEGGISDSGGGGGESPQEIAENNTVLNPSLSILSF